MDVSVIIPYCEADGLLERAKVSARRALDRAGVDGEVIDIDDSKRRGVSDARNRGLERAAGEWIVFADADDEMEETFFERLFLPYYKDDFDIIAGGHRVFDEGGIELDAYRWPSGVMSGFSFIERRLLERDAHVWGKIYRRESIGADTFDTEMSIGEDMLFLADEALKLGKRRAIMAVDEPVYRYYVNPRGAMEKPFEESFLDELKCWRLLGERLKPFADVLSPYAFSALGTIRIRSALMVAVRIGRLPESERQSSAAVRGLEMARENFDEAMRTRGAFAGLTARDKARALLFKAAPGIFEKALK